MEWIEEAGGEVVFSDFNGTVDYLITPVTGQKREGMRRYSQTSMGL